MAAARSRKGATKKSRARRKATRKGARTKGTRRAKGTRTKGTWGGRRPGAGRPKGSGKGPSPFARRNRVAVMLTDEELAALRSLATRSDIPVSTAAYRLIARSLSRARG